MIAGIILGAGEGNRMGKEKLLLPLGHQCILEWVIKAAHSSLLGKIFLVIRPEDNKLAEIGKKWAIEINFNPDYSRGMSTSIQKALLQINSREINGFLLILGDQPFITPAIINQLIASFTPGNHEIVVPYYKEKRGNPVLFDIFWKDELMSVTGDVGGRVLIKKYPEKVKKIIIPDEAIIMDIDIENDYLKAQQRFYDLQQKGNK